MAADSSSTSAFVTSLIFNSIIGLIFIILFMTIRTKFKRTYEPRTLKDIDTMKEVERSEPVPTGFFSWIPFLLSKRHSYLIQHTSIDGYLFLRYLGIITCISFSAFFILFPILLPVNATNGKNLQGFELLSMSNVENKNRFYAHVFLSWIWFSFIIFIVYKELYYYVLLRHSLQTTPLYDGLLSSRTIILTQLNPSKASELERIFTKANTISIAKNVKELQKLCDERKEDAERYEVTLNKMIKKSVGMKLKADKKPKYHDKLYEDGKRRVDDLETYIPYEKRPKHYIGSKLPWLLKMLNGKKVNTITYLNEHIPELNDKINENQNYYERNHNFLNTAFIQFDTQLEAQKIYQTLDYLLGRENYHKKYIGYSSDQIIWENMNLGKKERTIKKVLATTALIALLIFWTIPVAVVGAITNISFLTDKVFFLRFINNLPDFLLGLITGILPSVALSILMSLVPVFIMKIGELRGLISKQQLDLYCHSWYFAFQVIETFIVTTCTSSAAATVTAIIDDPSQAMTLLSNNLPKAANFYISYFLLLGLLTTTASLLQLVTLVISKIKTKLCSTPRKKWENYNILTKPVMGIIYPSIEIIAIILICYSIISPLVLVFSTLALFLMYIAFSYNLNYVLGFSFDMKGRNYPIALFHIFVGIYLSEVCLIGLFVMLKSWGCVVLEAFFLVITALLHIWFKRKFIPLFDIVPLSAIYLARGDFSYSYPSKDLGASEVNFLRERVKKSLEEDETGGILRLATDHELKNANILPFKQQRGSDLISSNESQRLTESDPSIGSGLSINSEEKKVAETAHIEDTPQPEDNLDRGTDIVPTAAFDESEGRLPSSKMATTFVKGDDTFKKLHYEDLDDLDKPALTNLTEEKIPGTIGHNTDVGTFYTDKAAMMHEGDAYPPNVNRNFSWGERIKHFFQPSKAYNFSMIRNRLPHVLNSTISYDKTFYTQTYINPCVNEKEPQIWVCKDPMGVSQQQIEEANNHNLLVTDAFTEFDDKGRAQFKFHPPDYEFEGKR